jgi:2-furoate---CoA ligase
MDLGSTLLAAFERSPNALALIDADTRLTYAELFERASRVASALKQRGVRRGDRVLVVLRNGVPMCTVYWAAQLLGAVFTPVNWRLAKAELAYIAADAEPRCTLGLDGCVGFEELCDSQPADFPPVEDGAISIMLYTSGTTGRPKGVPRSHRAERAAALAHVAQNRYTSGEVTLGVMPLYHTMGIRSLIAMALVNGAFVAMPRFDPAEALDLIEREKVTNLYLAPTLYYDLLGVPDLGRRDLRSLRKIGYAGAPMTPALTERCFAAFQPDVFVNHYGSTEIYTFTVCDRLREKPGCAGKAGLNERIRVVRIGGHDPDAPVAPNEVGEIVAHLGSEEAFSGYWKRPDADAHAIVGGWYFTGDCGYIDEDGDLFVVGRVDDMIITGGENVYPIEVEEVLARHPAVGRVAVVGVADERLGQKIVAFVEPSRPSLTSEELDAFAKASMTAFKRPREYVFVASIPQSPSGKVLRTRLRAGDYEPLR